MTLVAPDPARAVPLPLREQAAVRDRWLTQRLLDVLPGLMDRAGIDLWLAALAYGAGGVTVLMTDAEAPQYAAALDAQMGIAQAVMSGLGYAGPHFQLLRVSSPDELAVALQHAPRGEAPAKRALFNVSSEKRNTLDYALDHLSRHAPTPVDEIALPAGSPFGAVDVSSGISIVHQGVPSR